MIIGKICYLKNRETFSIVTLNFAMHFNIIAPLRIIYTDWVTCISDVGGNKMQFYEFACLFNISVHLPPSIVCLKGKYAKSVFIC